MTAKYGDGLPKADSVWDFAPSVKNYGTIEPPASSGDQYSVKIFQWIRRKNVDQGTKAGRAAFRCRGYLGDSIPIDAAEIFVRALNDGYPIEKVFRGQKTGTFCKGSDLPRYLPIQYREWKLVPEKYAPSAVEERSLSTPLEQLSIFH